MGLYHFMEYVFKLCFHNYDLSWHDFQIDHSWAYAAAMLLCLVEYGSKQALISKYADSKDISPVVIMSLTVARAIDESMVSVCVSHLGKVLIFVGHYFRIHSMFHAKSNFNHLV